MCLCITVCGNSIKDCFQTINNTYGKVVVRINILPNRLLKYSLTVLFTTVLYCHVKEAYGNGKNNNCCIQVGGMQYLNYIVEKIYIRYKITFFQVFIYGSSVVMMGQKCLPL